MSTVSVVDFGRAGMSILKFLGFRSDPRDPERPTSQTDAVRKIVEELEHLEPERARFVAAFAYILSRVAHADSRISVEETRAMERIVVQHGELSEEQAMLVTQMAKTHNALFGGTENYLVTKEFKRMATSSQKQALLRCLFAVSAADESITTVEDNVIRQIADELGMEHREFIGARSAFREHLAVLRSPKAGKRDG
jgi:uncharacterized tellurite resistance protein B-like protein